MALNSLPASSRPSRRLQAWVPGAIPLAAAPARSIALPEHHRHVGRVLGRVRASASRRRSGTFGTGWRRSGPVSVEEHRIGHFQLARVRGPSRGVRPQLESPARAGHRELCPEWPSSSRSSRCARAREAGYTSGSCGSTVSRWPRNISWRPMVECTPSAPTSTRRSPTISRPARISPPRSCARSSGARRSTSTTWAPAIMTINRGGRARPTSSERLRVFRPGAYGSLLHTVEARVLETVRRFRGQGVPA